MLGKELLNELNEQITFEFLSSHLYLQMAAYCHSIDLDGFANFFVVQSEEERFHAMKFFRFINDMDGEVQISGFDLPQHDFKDILDVFETALNHEKGVTERIYKLMELATDKKEHATISMLKWFIDEQVEEEANFKSIKQKVLRSKADIAFLYKLDDEFAARTFVPPANA